MNHPTELVGDILSTDIAGYSVLQIGVGAVAVGAAIWGFRALYDKALGKR